MFTTLRWMETFIISHGRQTHINTEVTESLQFNVLIRKDAKLQLFAKIRAKAVPSPQLF